MALEPVRAVIKGLPAYGRRAFSPFATIEIGPRGDTEISRLLVMHFDRPSLRGRVADVSDSNSSSTGAALPSLVVHRLCMLSGVQLPSAAEALNRKLRLPHSAHPSGAAADSVIHLHTTQREAISRMDRFSVHASPLTSIEIDDEQELLEHYPRIYDALSRICRDDFSAESHRRFFGVQGEHNTINTV